MKSLPHVRLLLALSLALLGSSALARYHPLPRLAAVRAKVCSAAAGPHLAAGGQRPALGAPERALAAPASLRALHAQRYERAERRARFEQAPLHSRRILLPQFVIVHDAPDDEDLADLRAEPVRYYPDVAEPSVDEVACSLRLPLQDQLERPPRA